jgi:hypothetical protein
MKLVPAAIFLYSLLLTTIIFNGLVPEEAQTGYSLINGTTIQNNTSAFDSSMNYYFWYMFINPTQLSTSIIWTVILASLAGLGLGVTISLVSKSDLGILLSVFVLIFGSGVIALIPVYHVVYSGFTEIAVRTGTVGCTIDAVGPATCKPSIILAGIIMGPLALYWFFVCLEFWTARSTS